MRANAILEQIKDRKRQQEQEDVTKRFQRIFENGFSTLPNGFSFRSEDPLGFNVFADPSSNGRELMVRLETPETNPRLVASESLIVIHSINMGTYARRVR